MRKERFGRQRLLRREGLPLMKKKKAAIPPRKSKMKSSFDVLGSYTGSYIAGVNEEPVQDVDDL